MTAQPSLLRLAAALPALLLLAAASPTPVAAQPCSGWQYIPAPRPLDDGSLRGVAGFAADDIWAVGSSRAFTSTDRFSVAVHWNGTAWTQVPTPNPGVYVGGGTRVSLEVVGGVAPDDVWAMGDYYTQHTTGGGWLGHQTLALHWDGETWDIVPTPQTPAGGTGAFINDIDPVASNQVWAAGGRVGSDFVGIFEVPLVLRWDGGQWSELPTPAPVSTFRNVLYSVKAFAEDDVLAAGGHSADTAGSPAWPYVVHWNGTTWERDETVPEPGALTYVRDMAALAPDDVWLVGSYWDDGTTRPLFLHRDAQGWQHVLPVGFDRPYGDLRGVVALAPDDIWAVGAYTVEEPPAIGYKLIMHWDGTAWTQVSADLDGPLDGTQWDIAVVPGGDLWIVGGDSAPDNPTERLCAGSFPLFTDGFEIEGMAPWPTAAGE